jgi:hypothetical protein
MKLGCVRVDREDLPDLGGRFPFGCHLKDLALPFRQSTVLVFFARSQGGRAGTVPVSGYTRATVGMCHRIGRGSPVRLSLSTERFNRLVSHMLSRP